MHDDVTDAQAKQVADTICERIMNAPRGIICTRRDGRAGFAMVGPNSLMWAWMMFPPEVCTEFIFDLHLN